MGFKELGEKNKRKERNREKLMESFKVGEKRLDLIGFVIYLQFKLQQVEKFYNL